ncbi:MAG TPA: SIMPL domain-containing protein [Thermomicrobiaceae bacterium]|nr:SIMPL domain-containing protein [Thermomicrobiaceae bacterium]
MSRAIRPLGAVVVIAALVVIGAFVAAVGGGRLPTVPPAAADTTSTTTRSITVQGTGQVAIAPDTAQVELGVQEQNADLATAQQAVNQKLTAVLAALKGAGIPANQIRTTNYSINVDRKDPTTPPTGYQVISTVQVTVQPVDKVGSIIDTAVAQGANVVYGIQFVLQNQDAAVKQARDLAMQDAHNRATQLAQLGNVSLGQPLTISEGAGTTPIRTDVSAAAGSVATPIQPGQNLVTVQVTVSYAIQ